MTQKIENLAHEIWTAAQCAPGEGIDDAAARIASILRGRGAATQPVAWFVDWPNETWRGHYISERLIDVDSGRIRALVFAGDAGGAEPAGWICEWPSGYRQFHDERNPMPSEWDDPPETITPLFSAPVAAQAHPNSAGQGADGYMQIRNTALDEAVIALRKCSTGNNPGTTLPRWAREAIDAIVMLKADSDTREAIKGNGNDK